jgi:predicted ATPase
VFTDVEGSTDLLRENGDAYGEILAEHNALLRGAWQQHGVEVRTEGDAFFVAFVSPRAAVAAVSSAQRALASHPWPGGRPVRVRMGVHSGEVQLRDGDYWGIDVHYAARLCAAAHGGQVLLSAATRGLAPDVDVEDIGEHALKDFPVARRLFHLIIDGQRSNVFPPPRTLSRSRTNLPSLATRLVGREVELADLTRRLTESDRRLVTVTGSGGSGKTKLAIAVAGELLERFPDGVFLVALAPVPGPAGVVPALVDRVAPYLRLKGEESALFVYLCDKEVLLMIDNFEHVLEAAPVIGRLLDRAPKVRVLVTSQAPLRLAAETIVPLAPLAVPGPGDSDLDRLASVAAVALFVERAQACDPSFSLTPSNASSVAELCRSLDGLPLALQLAAARIRLVGVGGLLEALRRGTEFLGPGSRDLPGRQRGLRAALGYTVSLLDDECRQLLGGLGAFADTWTIDDAEKVFGADMDLWEAMATLLDLSLIRTRGDGRLTMAERVKTHARELLARSGREAEVRARHAALMAEIAETIDVGYWFDTTGLVVRTRENLEELEYAISWSRQHRPDLFRRLLGGCARTFWVIGRLDPLVGDIDRLSEQEDGSDITSGCIFACSWRRRTHARRQLGSPAVGCSWGRVPSPDGGGAAVVGQHGCPPSCLDAPGRSTGAPSVAGRGARLGRRPSRPSLPRLPRRGARPDCAL